MERYENIEKRFSESEDLKNEKSEIQIDSISSSEIADTIIKQLKEIQIIPLKYQNIVSDMQDKRVIEDPKLTELEAFLSNKVVGDKVCSRMIWAEAFKGIIKDATHGDFKIIGNYMNKFKNWKRVNQTITFEKYGKQKYWEKMEEF